jgi:hypothetical protein
MRDRGANHSNATLGWSVSTHILYNRPEVAAVPGDVSPTPQRKKKYAHLLADFQIKSSYQGIRAQFYFQLLQTYCHDLGGCAWLIDGFWIGWLNLLAPYTHHSELQAIYSVIADHNSVTVQNRTHVYMNFFDHKDLGNHLLQLCSKLVKHPVFVNLFSTFIQWTDNVL